MEQSVRNDVLMIPFRQLQRQFYCPEFIRNGIQAPHFSFLFFKEVPAA
jgi:hypothetical protein